MAEPIFELVQIDRGLEPKSRPRYKSKDYIEYTIKDQDLMQWPDLVLYFLALKFYDDTSYWTIIADANPVKGGWNYEAGDSLKIPSI
ncbi:unnamed protein product [marine sediment metagenome]|uniref:LysM domain-containing protein n=1 Tax=marine sediment metagenome TaxID=412755 RepID=X1ANU2_9ZZZZ